MKLPPDRPTNTADGPRVTCPFCGSPDTEQHALFGSMLLLTQHYCRACHSLFERVRDDGPQTDQESPL